MDRRRFLKGVGYGSLGMLGAAACTAVPSPRGSAAATRRPNILLILADDMGFSDVGCYGGEITTPNIDRLAQEGQRFSQFYNVPRCCPSRAAMLTGLYPHQAGMGAMTTNNFTEPAYQGHLNERCVTIAEALKPAGYRSVMAGKWHVGYKDPAYWPESRGFDRFYGEHRYVDDYFKPTHQLYLNGEPVAPEGADWYSTDAYTDYALRFMEEARQDDVPFFSYVAYNAPHFPLQAFQEDIDKYRGRYMEGWDVLRRRRYERQVDMGLLDPDWSLSTRALSPHAEPLPSWDDVPDKAMWDLKMAAYAAQVDRMDQNIGRLLRWLDETGQADNTIVLFMSDNGGCAEDWINRRNPPGALPGDRNAMLAYGAPWANLSNTPFRFYKQWTHEGGIAAPLIARLPGGGRSAGSISHEVGHMIDVLPTCLEAAGVAYPEVYEQRALLPVEGRSLWPVLQGRQRDGHEALFWEHVGNRAVRQGDWKLVSRSRFTPGDWELYNMNDDRTETSNLAAAYPERVHALSSAYARWAERVGVIPWDELTAKD